MTQKNKSIWLSVKRKFTNKLRRNKIATVVVVCITCVLLFAVNSYNPTLLPEQLRFAPICTRLSEPEIANSQHSDISAAPKRISYPAPIVRDYTYFNEHSWMPRFLDLTTHRRSMELIRDLDALFRDSDVTYVIFHGTLLGSFFFHDLIPWDDDLDVIVDFKHVNKVRAIFRKPEVQEKFGLLSFHDDYNIYAEPYIQYDVDPNNSSFCGGHPYVKDLVCFHKFHFFYKDSGKTLQRGIGYPYIDVKYYVDNNTHVWHMDLARDPFYYPMKHFFPLTKRPFFNMWLPAPARSDEVLRLKFVKFQCASKWYSHHTQTIAMGYQSRCDIISTCYPYVNRLMHCISPKNSNTESCEVLEQLKLGEMVIYEVIVDEKWIGTKQPFQF